MGSGNWHQDVSMENARAASMAIRKTIRNVEEALGIAFPRGGSPSEDRDMMVEVLRDLLYGR